MAGGFSLVPFNRRKELTTNNVGLEDFFEDFFGLRNLEKVAFRLDIHDNDKEYIIEADIPGAQKDEIIVNLVDGQLTISVDREEAAGKDKKNYLHKERRFTSMSRTIQLANTDPDGIKAKLEHGVLTVTVPKLEKKDTSKKIEIE